MNSNNGRAAPLLRVLPEPSTCPQGGAPACTSCGEMCKRPAWPTPDEAQALIDAGYGERLMLDWWGCHEGDDIEILCPAIGGYEGSRAPWMPRGERACTFFTPDGHCELHGTGLKPLEARLAVCDSVPGDPVAIDDAMAGIHEHMASLWDTPAARALVESWRQRHNDPSPERLLLQQIIASFSDE